MTRFVRFVLRTLRGEWDAIVVDPVRRLMRRGPAGLLLAFVAAFGVIFFHAIAQHPRGETVVRLVGGVQADLPLWQALLRTPVSLYVPALDLPVWAGITQLFLAFALAELTLGRGRTLFISYATTLAGTLTVRVMLAMGPGWWGLGLPPEVGHVLDTGPSAAVVGLFTYLSVVRRAPVVFFLTGGSMVVESVLKPNLAGREHLIAVATALILALIDERAWRLLRRRPRRAPDAPAEAASGADCGVASDADSGAASGVAPGADSGAASGATSGTDSGAASGTDSGAGSGAALRGKAEGATPEAGAERPPAAPVRTASPLDRDDVRAPASPAAAPAEGTRHDRTVPSAVAAAAATDRPHRPDRPDAPVALAGQPDAAAAARADRACANAGRPDRPAGAGRTTRAGRPAPAERPERAEEPGGAGVAREARAARRSSLRR
ncbi:hypothetical protein [Streptomyces sp. Amel2xE9]|uniref:hypothetical protein n=1 Tax=Streptomyces sp. Amel2xE9 TaxID=1157634 RepID=UPI00036D1E82